MKKFLLVSMLAISLTACGNTATTPATNTSTPIVSPSTTSKQYSLADIAKHATKTDCWMAIHGKVYNVTGFIASAMHPGGDEIIRGCGKDATSIFEARQEPGEPAEPHSAEAKAGLSNFYIGELK